MNARGGVASTSPLGLHTETVRDAMARADSVSGDKWYSGVMLHNKDLRRVVLMVNEYRALTSELAAAKEEIERLKEKARDCERRTFRYGEEAKEAEERAAAAETALAARTAGMREAAGIVDQRGKEVKGAIDPTRTVAAILAAIPTTQDNKEG